MKNNKAATVIANACCGCYTEETKTRTLESNKSAEKNKEDAKKCSWFYTTIGLTISHYVSLFILGLLTWGLLWCTFGEKWIAEGPWLHITAVVSIAWLSGDVLQAMTDLPPLIAALLTGIFARHFGILDMRQFSHIDMFFRKIYPVVILGKASLGWNVGFMASNWRQITVLGVVPWTLEVVTLTVCTHLLLGFPWLWGILLGSIYASVSCAVVMPSVQKLGSKVGGSRNWAQLVCTAGGIDTALSVGVYGLIHSFMFADTGDNVYRYCRNASVKRYPNPIISMKMIRAGKVHKWAWLSLTKDVISYCGALLAVPAGIALGVIWGCLAGLLPHPRDTYLPDIRILFVLLGGLFGNYFTSHIGWGGTGGVAVLACNATAATHWAQQGWTLNNNPASRAYRVLWAALEPTLFVFTGSFFVLNTATARTMLYGVGILCICLSVRLAATYISCWNMSIRERAFVCCTWIPKSIVEAVLCPVAIHTLVMGEHLHPHREFAEDLLRLIVQLILITTPIGYLSTHYLGPMLLRPRGIDPEAPRKLSTASQSAVTDKS